MNTRTRVGLLPLYLKLYDDRLPDVRKRVDGFLVRVQAGLAAQGLSVEAAPVCRVRAEFERAVRRFEKNGVECIVTLHLAYSPSLESVDALSRTRLPIVICDTTMDWDFGPTVDLDRLMYNHGIHGVQDLACMLRRRGKEFAIAAGHVSRSDVLARTAELAKAARAAVALRGARVLRIGDSFAGMGDFAVDASVLKRRLGISVRQAGPEAVAAMVRRVSAAQVAAEIAADRRHFAVRAPLDVHRRSARVGLALRKMLEDGGFTAFSMNFMAFGAGSGAADTVPFLEASKAMARGVGYAGEGDVLTAALVGALSRAFGRTTFTEMFCPDWKGNMLFLSHMGEINPEIAAAKPLVVEKPFPWTDAENPAVLACGMAWGEATLVNLAPAARGKFRLIVAPVKVCGDSRHRSARETIRGWIKPNCGAGEFLEAFSRAGGTHHSALVYGRHAEAMEAFAIFAGLEFVRVG